MANCTTAGRVAALSIGAATLAAALIPTAATAQPVETGIRVAVADRLPRWDAERGGYWTVVPAGSFLGKPVARSNDDETAVPPGAFDIYWIADADHAEVPLIVAQDVVVRSGQVTEVFIQTGLVIEVADWVPPIDPARGRISAVQDGTNNAVQWTTGLAMVLPPDRFALYWDTDVNDDERPVWVGTYDVELPFTGVGLELSAEPAITVVRAVTGGPAEAAGIRPGDVVVAVEGTDTMGMALGDTVDLIRGPAGTPVVLTILRPGVAEPLAISVQRSLVEPQNIARIDAGIRLVLDPALPPLGPGGWWGVVYDGEDPADPAARAFTADAVLLVGHTTYDLYWTADGNSAPRLVAAGIVADTGILEVPVGPPAPIAVPTKPRPG